MKNFKAFTLAEILISLTIIGIVAAITLPALQGNVSEKTWYAQRKALYSRLSQALAVMPSLNGFGAEGTAAEVAKYTAQTFVTDGLSKVFQIDNICDNQHFADCNFPSKITILGGGSTIAAPKKMSNLNTTIMYVGNPEIAHYMIDSDAVAFETANGESVLAFYNPYCILGDISLDGQSSIGQQGIYHKIHVCANFIFDLNGVNGPNTIGKDIGFITALYPVDPNVVMAIPMAMPNKTYKQTEIVKVCKNINEEYTAPNADEAVSLYYNNAMHTTKRSTWTTTMIDEDHGYWMGESYGIIYPDLKTKKVEVTCIKR